MLSRLMSGKVQPEPFPLVCRLAARPAIAAQLKKSLQASAQSLAKLPRSSLILAPREWHEVVWTNLNRPEDYEKFVASLI